MGRDLERIFAVLVLARVVELILYRGAPPPVVALLAVGCFLLIAGWQVRFGAATIAVLSFTLPMLELSLYNHHLMLIGSIAIWIALRAPAPVLMVQASVVYGFAALAKLNPYWLSGWPLASSFNSPLGSLLAEAQLLVPLAVATIAAEGFIAMGLWWSRTRPWAMLVGVGLHIGMFSLMTSDVAQGIRLAVFGGLLVSLYPLFVPSTPTTVVWDDSCAYCAGWVRWLRRLDRNRAATWLPLSNPKAYEPIGVSPHAASRAIQVRLSDGSVHAGFEGLRRLALTLPLLVPLTPILSILPIRWAGNRVYGRVASRRSCPVGPSVA